MASKKCSAKSPAWAKKMAWGMILFLGMSFAIVVISMFAAKSAHAADGFQWQHFGADPYASSRDEAMQTRESAFRALGLPPPVITQFLRATESPGEKTRLVVGDKLSAMLSSKGVVHRNVTVAFTKPPKSDKMEFAAPAEKWQVSWEGRLFTVILPEVCNNWSSIVAPVAQPEKASVPLPAVAGCPDVRRLSANAWSLSAMPSAIREKAEALIRAAEDRDTQNATNAEAYKPDALSRTLGGQLRREVKVRASVTGDIRVRLLDPTTLRVVEELPPLHLVDGMDSILLSNDQRAKIVETIWPRGFVSPVVSGGERRLWFFPREWGKECEMNIHGALQ
ncbi:MAG: hypothetical protein WAV50_03360 [Minisyncoccia bacterium]